MTFNLNGSYELGEVLSSAMGRFKEFLKEATEATASWNEGDAQEIEVLSTERKKIYHNLGKEQWAVNVNVHYNDWANFERKDFQPVIDAFKALFNLFICPTCGGILYLVKEGNTNKNVRCPCNEVSWNLEKKSD